MLTSAFQPLTTSQRDLLRSTALMLVATPVLSTFLYTFLWREYQSAVPIIMFTLGVHACSMLVFLFNAWIARYVTMSLRIFLGCVGQGIGPLLVIFLSPSTPVMLFAAGMMLGLPSGLYWANRNEMTSVLTTARNRVGFLLREQVVSAVTSIVIPASIGYAFWQYASDVGRVYAVLACVTVSVLLASGVFAYRAARGQRSRSAPILIGAVPRHWNALRAFEMTDGAITVIETMLVLLLGLRFLGLEDAIGGLKAATGIIAVLAMYLIGRRLTTSTRVREVFLGAGVLLTVASGALAIWWKPWAFLVYASALAIIGGMRGSAFMAVVYQGIARMLRATNASRAALLADREVFLTLGRTLALIALLPSLIFFETTTLRYALIISALLHAALLYYSRAHRTNDAQ